MESKNVDKIQTLAQIKLGLIWAKTLLSREDLTSE
jgi:hypothetical protein